MTYEQIKSNIMEIQKSLEVIQAVFDISKLKAELNKLEQEQQEPQF